MYSVQKYKISTDFHTYRNVPLFCVHCFQVIGLSVPCLRICIVCLTRNLTLMMISVLYIPVPTNRRYRSSSVIHDFFV